MFAQPVSASFRRRTSRLKVSTRKRSRMAPTAARTIQRITTVILGWVDAVVMAAGEGRRLRPLSERWAKPVLPIDGRPLLALLLRELAAADFERVWLVTGHLAEQVEKLAGDGSAFGLEVRFVRQPRVLGSADAVRRALDAEATLPLLVSAADTVFFPGDIERFAKEFTNGDTAGAVAVRLSPAPGPGRNAVRSSDGRVERMREDRKST